MKKSILFTILLTVLLSVSCSTVKSTQGSLTPIGHTKTKIEYLSLDKDSRQGLGIGLNTSPDKKSYFLLDPISNFRKIYLKENGTSESMIFDYIELYGEGAVRDMDELQVFWGGMSDRIYLYRPFSDTQELSFYLLNTQSWAKEDISFMNEYRIVKALNQTNCLLASKDGIYYSINMADKVIKQLSIPANSFIGDENMQQLLFTYVDTAKDSEVCRVGIYDLDKEVVRYIDSKNPVSRDALAYFVPNSSKEISYLTEAIDNNGFVSSHLEIYNMASGSSTLIHIGDGLQSFLGWDIKGQTFYGVDYMMER